MAGEERSVKVKIDHVEKIYEGRNGKMIALNGVDFEIKENEFICVVGPSGCGKTTLLRCIAGFQVATSGDILLNGKDVTDMPPHKRPVNTVFQKYALFPHLNVFDNIAFGLKLKKMSKPEIEKKVKVAFLMFWKSLMKRKRRQWSCTRHWWKPLPSMTMC